MPIYKEFMVKVLSELLAEEADHKKELKRNLAKLSLRKLQRLPLCMINSLQELKLCSSVFLPSEQCILYASWKWKRYIGV